jgi:uroporphyrinogen-III synthase
MFDTVLAMNSRPKRVLVTRSPKQASELADGLRAVGMEPILIPTIELAPPSSYAELDAVIGDLNAFDWLLFTSANAVEAFGERLRFSQKLVGRCFVAAIGPATTRALAAIGMTVDLTPQQAVAESFADALLPRVTQPDGTPTRFLLVRAEQARDHLPETLRDAGAAVTLAAAYRTVIPEASIVALRELFRDPASCPDAITFTSSSTATNLIALLHSDGLELPASITRASIGPITSQTLRELGFPPHVEAREATIAAMVEALKAI